MPLRVSGIKRKSEENDVGQRKKYNLRSRSRTEEQDSKEPPPTSATIKKQSTGPYLF